MWPAESVTVSKLKSDRTPGWIGTSLIPIRQIFARALSTNVSYLYLLAPLALIVFIVFSPAHLLYDEPFHINLAHSVRSGGWSVLISGDNPSPAGPLFTALHLAVAPITDLKAPAIRWINVVCTLAAIMCLAAWLRRFTSSPMIRACQLFAVPFLWPTMGMALTEVPALCAFTVFGYLAASAMSSASVRARHMWPLALGGGLALGIAILGRQTYLVVLPCLVAVAFWSRIHALTLLTMMGAAVASSAWLFVLWGGLVPPSYAESFESVLRPHHAVLALTYAGIAAFFVTPWRTLVPNVQIAVYTFGASLAVTLLLFPDVAPPAASLLTRLVGHELTTSVGLGARVLMTAMGLLWLWYTLRQGWLRRQEADYLLITLMLLTLVAAPVRLVQFSSRYVVGALGLLVVQLCPPAPAVTGDLLRLLLGILVGVGTLWSYYHQ
jgi:hypothetical protein